LKQPNIVLILVDDMGFSDIGSFGGEIETPNLDRLASRGVSMSQFYNTARCSPSRASLLTGLHPHQTGVALLVSDDSPEGYGGTLTENCVTLAEVLRDGGYGTSMSGKWHITGRDKVSDSTWPRARGFDRFFGTINGAGSYFAPETLVVDDEVVDLSTLPSDFYYTDAISDWAVQFISDHLDSGTSQPFFSYVAYTAPHWPLQATEKALENQRGNYDAGWDSTRKARIDRQAELEVFDAPFDASERDPEVPAWADAEDPQWEARRMEAYAAQITVLDEGVGRILSLLDERGISDDTIVIFLSDNGGSAEELPKGWNGYPIFPSETPDGRAIRYGNSNEIDPGDQTSFLSYGRAWANVSNAPFREYKHWVHEGGIATPLIASWPAGFLDANGRVHSPHQLPDIFATLLEATGLSYPTQRNGTAIPAIEGQSMLAEWRGEEAQGESHTLFWEHEGNKACRRGPWKLVAKYQRKWELYDMRVDRAELDDLADHEPDVVAELSEAWAEWAARVGVRPREEWDHRHPYGGI
jgi:arylsulfatase A-like enzyme